MSYCRVTVFISVDLGNMLGSEMYSKTIKSTTKLFIERPRALELT